LTTGQSLKASKKAIIERLTYRGKKRGEGKRRKMGGPSPSLDNNAIVAVQQCLGGSQLERKEEETEERVGENFPSTEL